MDKEPLSQKIGVYGCMTLLFGWPFLLGIWEAQPDNAAVCVPERHWWIMSKLPTCAEAIDELQARVSALEDKLHTTD